jgi:uncharacterized membrane protein
MAITKKHLLSFAFLSIFALLLIHSSLPARADQPLFDSQVGLTDVGKSAFGSSNTPADIRLTMARIINVVLSFLGIVFLVLAVLAGFQYMTSEGNEEKTHEAMALLRNAIIGMIIILAAWILTRYSIIILSKAVNNSINYQFYPSY